MSFKNQKSSFFILFIILIAIYVVLFSGISPANNTPAIYSSYVDSVNKVNPEPEIQNLKTFAKLYGYVRFFHPGDQANAIDWDHFALHGVQSVKNAETREELKNKLSKLFHPIAPTVQIYSTDESVPPPASLLTPDNTSDLNLIAWQHRGFGFGESNAYKSIRLNRPLEDPADPLFEEHPDAGEVVEKFLGRGLSAQIPLALFSNEGQTLRPDNAPSITPLRDSLQSVPIDTVTGANKALRHANVIIAWNILQHFYPYFDVVDVNWDNVLSESLRKASKDYTADEFLKTLKQMMVKLKDGHALAHLPPQGEETYKWLPFTIREVEGKPMITAVSNNAEENACFKQGDIITSVDGKPAKEWVKSKKKLISGTPQWKTNVALRQLSYGLPGEEVALGLKRPGESTTCNIIYDNERSLEIDRPGPIEEMQQNIYYVDLRNAEMKTLKKKIEQLANAEGIIFDLRGYPNGTHEILQHLSKDTLRSARWMTPQIIYPDQENLVGYDTSGRWVLPPKEPYFSGKNVFLTNKEAISYSESIMGIVEHYDLAEIVGETTAGANGEAVRYTLPGNYTIRWTGMKVVKHDSSQHHLVGIKPTIPVEPTIEKVRAGKDEYIEEALKVINLAVDN